MKNIDELLQDALFPAEEMSEALKTRIITEVTGEKEQSMENIVNIESRRKRFPIAAVIAAAVLMAISITAFAAWKYLSAREVADKLEDEKLTTAFTDQVTWIDGETQSCGGYDIALLGLVSGSEISDYLITYNGEVYSDKTYVVVAISKTDGTPMPDTSSDDYGEVDFLVSPYFEGLDPKEYNIFSLGAGGYSAVVENGIQYRIVETANIEAFADREVYLGVSEGTFLNRNAYIFHEETGKITRNEAYSGVNALFVLPLDPAKADADKANAILDKIDNH